MQPKITQKFVKLRAKDLKPMVKWLHPNNFQIIVIMDLKSFVEILSSNTTTLKKSK